MDTLAQSAVETKTAQPYRPGLNESWQMVTGQLRMEMRRAEYETWVAPLQPLGFQEGVYRLGGINRFGLDWVESRLRSRIAGLLEGVLNQPVTLKFALINGFHGEPPALDLQTPADAVQAHPLEGLSAASLPVPEAPAALVSGPTAEVVPPAISTAVPEAIFPEIQEKTNGNGNGRKKRTEPEKGEGGSPRKIQLQRAYGSERARVVQPERGMFLTNYLFSFWLPLLGHSAFAAILAARSLCYWNPMTGELRNVIETDMGELARRANVSVRTIKDVLNNDLVKRYFLRYKVRRLMTPNGVRTAGILLQVRMDDPLTPEDQANHSLPEDEHWYTIDIEEDLDD